MGLVQSASNTTSDGSSFTVTLGSDTTAGHCLIAGVGTMGESAVTISSIKNGGTAADNWASAKTESNTEADVSALAWTDQNCAGSVTSLTIALSATCGAGGYVDEWAGVISTGALDKSNGGTTNDSSSFSSGSSGTLTDAVEVAYGVAVALTESAGSLTGPASPWTNHASLSLSYSVEEEDGAAIVGYQQVDATTALTYSGTVSTTGFTAAVVITLILSTGVTVDLPVGGYTTQGYPVGPPIYIDLPVGAYETEGYTAQGVAGVIVNLPTGSYTTEGYPVTPDLPAVVKVALPPCGYTTTGYDFTDDVVPVLLVSIASKAGVDPFGNSYPQGLYAGAGVIEGPTIIGSESLFYSTTPGQAGTLIQSSSAVQGEDEYGNFVFQGFAIYQQVASDLFYVIQINANAITWWQGSAYNGPFSTLFSLTQEGTGLVINSNTVTFSGDGISVGNGSSASLDLNPEMATPANYAAVNAGTATLAEVCACLAGVINSLNNRGMMST